MRVYNNAEHTNIKNPVVTTGIFDGVHLGHKTILNKLSEIAIKENGEKVVVTFWPHPKWIIQKDSGLKLINTLDEKKQLLEKYEVDHLIILPFNKQFSKLSSGKFIEDYLVKKIGLKNLVVGYNHHFGKNREGNYGRLLHYADKNNFTVEKIGPAKISNLNISSTDIRYILQNGEIQKANKLLGYNYFLNGKVIPGDKMGEKIGFPTANINVSENYKLVPPDGVYIVEAEIENKKYKGMLNIGHKPTFHRTTTKNIEVHIFDFNQNIYKKSITIFFHKRLREEIKFNSQEGLIQQIKEDKKESLIYFNKNS